MNARTKRQFLAAEQQVVRKCAAGARLFWCTLDRWSERAVRAKRCNKFTLKIVIYDKRLGTEIEMHAR